MITIVFEAVFFPIFILLGIMAAKRRKAQRDARMEEFRRSADSRLIRLNN